MPDSKVTDLTSAGTLDGTEVLYAVKDPSGTPLDRKTTAGAIKTLSIGAGSVSIASGKTFTSSNTLTLAGTDSTTMTFPSTSATLARTDAGNTFTGAQTFSVGTVNGTGLDISQTWTGTGTYTGLKYNVGTDSGPSNAASLLLDLQVGGASQFNLSKSGAATFVTGSKTAPSIKFAGLNGGLYGRATGFVTFTNGTVECAQIGGNSSSILGQLGFAAAAGGGGDLSTGAADMFLNRPAAATLQLGAADAAAPVAQTFKVQSVVGSTPGASDVAGANFTIQGSAGRGSGAGGSIIFQVAPAGSAGTGAQNAYSTALTIDSTRLATFGGNISGPINANLSITTGSAGYALLLNGGASIFSDRLRINAGAFLSFFSSSVDDVQLYRDAANTLALRNGTNAQLFRVYSTYNGTNDAYGAIGAAVNLDGTAGDANTLYIGSQKKGSPTALTKLVIQVDGTKRLDYGDSNASTFTFNSRIRVTQTTQCYAGFAAGGVVNYLGTAGATDDVVVGTVAGDAYFRIDNKSMLFSVDNGATIPLRIKPSSSVIVGSAALATTATDGFLYIPTCAGTPTGTPTTQTGTAPIVYDTSNNKLYIYNGGWKSATFA